MLLLKMLTTVDFNDQLRINAYEINNESADFDLTAKLVTAAPATAKKPPELSFRTGLLATQAPRDGL
jgi:hypothetical protein